MLRDRAAHSAEIQLSRCAHPAANADHRSRLVVARDRSGYADAFAGFAIFALLSTGALLGLFTYFVRRPDGADNWLASIGERIERAGPMLFTAGCAFGGAYLLVDGIRRLR